MALPKELERIRLTKRDRLEGWVEKALYYSNKEHFTKVVPRPGEIYTIDFGENVGSEVNNVRPALILTATNYNRKSGVVTVCPFSRKEVAETGQVLINEEVLKEGEVSGVIKTEMLTTVSKGRIGDYVGRLNKEGINRVNDILIEFLTHHHSNNKEA